MSLRTAQRAAVAALVLAGSGGLACQFDPVVDNAVSALGGEAPGVRRGPTHRPGQPCLLCHDGALGDPPAFSLAGTIYQVPSSTFPETGATVSFTDATGTTRSTTTNSVGNFYLTPSQWSPVFPLTNVTVMSSGGAKATMQSEIGRDGACATCHFDPAGPASPGHVSIFLDDGGVPP